MGRAHSTKGPFPECKQLLHAMAQLQTGELKLTGHFAHSLTCCCQQVDASLSQLPCWGLGEIAPIAHDDAIFEPAGEGIEQVAIIDRGRGEIERTKAPRFVTLHVELQALPPAHAILRLARPVAKSAMLSGPRDMADGNGGPVLQDHGIAALGVAITMQDQREQGTEFDTVPIGHVDKFTVGSQRRELLSMIPPHVKIHLGFVLESAPRTPDSDHQHFRRTQHGSPPTGLRGSCLARNWGCSTLISSSMATDSLSRVSGGLILDEHWDLQALSRSCTTAHTLSARCSAIFAGIRVTSDAPTCCQELSKL